MQIISTGFTVNLEIIRNIKPTAKAGKIKG